MKWIEIVSKKGNRDIIEELLVAQELCTVALYEKQGIKMYPKLAFLQGAGVVKSRMEYSNRYVSLGKTALASMMELYGLFVLCPVELKWVLSSKRKYSILKQVALLAPPQKLLQDSLEMQESNISHCVARLSKSGLVEKRRDGVENVLSIPEDIKKYVHRFVYICEKEVNSE